MAGLIACLAQTSLNAEEAHPRSMLVLDQSDARSPFYYQVFASLRAVVNASPGQPVTIYAESLDVSRFSGPAYESGLQQHFQAKYRGRPIGVLVAIGSGALDYVSRWRSELWPGVPVVFAMVDESTAARMKLQTDVTGSIMKLRFADMMSAAHAVVPDLKRIAFVGDVLEGQTIYRHWRDEIPDATAGLEIIDLTGLPMREVRQRVAKLPDQTAILYTAIYSDGEGTLYVPANALALIAEVASRPIVITAESELGRGGIGGFLMCPSLIGESVAGLAMRILDGESPELIPAAPAQVVRPIFDWRQMQRWGVSASSLPPGSEIRFREPTAWEQYRWQIITIAGALLFQTGVIILLFYEHRRRYVAEFEARRRMSELAHMARHATVGEMSASIAHELNQPLGAILSNAEAAELLLNFPSPNLDEIREILVDIRRDDRRASEVIRRLRSLLKKNAFEIREIDLNETVREAFDFMSAQASAHNVTLNKVLAPQRLPIKGDPIQLQQVILNLIANGMEAMAGNPVGRRRIVGRAARANGATVELSISDSGPGVPPDRLRKVFEPFFTTKEHGMGMGLSIARTIIEAHAGRIWVENEIGGGAVFRFRLPLAGTL
jgi:signal transduction histidine kinase